MFLKEKPADDSYKLSLCFASLVPLPDSESPAVVVELIVV